MATALHGHSHAGADGGLRIPRTAGAASADRHGTRRLAPPAIRQNRRGGPYARRHPGGGTRASSTDLIARKHLRERGFWDAYRAGVIPGLPWRASYGRVSGPAPKLGGDTDAVLGDVLGYSSADIAALREAGTLG
jgi:hypothetical protein